MIASENNGHDLDTLFAAVCDGRASDEQLAEFDMLIETDSNVCQLYLEYASLSANLHEDAASRHSETGASLVDMESIFGAPTEVRPQPASREFSRSFRDLIRRREFRVPVTIASLIMAVSLGVLSVIPMPKFVVKGDNTPTPEKRTNAKPIESVARLVADNDAQWHGSVDNPVFGRKEKIKTGMKLYPGQKLELASGVAEFKFFNGAEVVLQGPAVFEVQGRKRCGLEFGDLVARADEERAKGFIVETPAAQVEDLGTEFGVSVDASGMHQVEVVDGKIKVLRFLDDAVVTLSAGEGIRLARNDPSDMVVTKLDDPRGFVVRGVLAKRYRGKTRIELEDAVTVTLFGTRTDPKTDVARGGMGSFDRATRFVVRERGGNRPMTEKQKESLQMRARLFLKFDVSRLVGRVDYASLQMKVAARLPNAGESAINIARVTSPWDTKSGNNFPVFKHPFEDAVATQIDDDAGRGTPVSVDITELVQGWVDGTHPNHGLVLYFAEREFIGQSYAAGKHDTPPTLSVTLSDMETPAETDEANKETKTIDNKLEAKETDIVKKHRKD